jgi:hypothetical protein
MGVGWIGLFHQGHSCGCLTDCLTMGMLVLKSLPPIGPEVCVSSIRKATADLVMPPEPSRVPSVEPEIQGQEARDTE